MTTQFCNLPRRFVIGVTTAAVLAATGIVVLAAVKAAALGIVEVAQPSIAARPGAVPAALRYCADVPGGVSSNAVYRLYEAVGQPVAGSADSGNMGLASGYVPIAGRFVVNTPSAVAFSSFRARESSGTVELEWEVGSARGLSRFRVYRAVSPMGPFADVSGGAGIDPEKRRFVDPHVDPGVTYFYRIGAVDADGEAYSSIVVVTVSAWRVSLWQNWPNPFNPATTIGFTLDRPRRTVLVVYDARGARVRVLVDAILPAGRHEVAWDGRGEGGSPVSSGIYFYRLRAGERSLTRKMTLLK